MIFVQQQQRRQNQLLYPSVHAHGVNMHTTGDIGYKGQYTWANKADKVSTELSFITPSTGKSDTYERNTQEGLLCMLRMM